MQTEVNVESLRLKFEKSRISFRKLASFDEFLFLFRTKRRIEIANLFGAKERAVNVLYRKVFKPLVDTELKDTRYKLMGNLVRFKANSLKIPDSVFLKPVSEFAKEAGLEVKLATSPDRTTKVTFRKRELMIEGKRCYISIAKTTPKFCPKANRSYTRQSFRKSEILKYDFIIVLRKLPGIPDICFIIPSSEIVAKYKGKFVQLCIPSKDDAVDPDSRAWCGKFQRIYFWQYANNWRQFKPFIPSRLREELL